MCHHVCHLASGVTLLRQVLSSHFMSWAHLRSLVYHRPYALVPFRAWRASPGTSHIYVVPYQHGRRQRTFNTAAVYTVLTPPFVFAGLVLSLWVYKCCMMIFFQNKIIYMPSVPPFSRSEKIADYAKRCSPIVWREETLNATDGVQLSLCIAGAASNGSTSGAQTHVIVLYFQG